MWAWKICYGNGGQIYVHFVDSNVLPASYRIVKQKIKRLILESRMLIKKGLLWRLSEIKSMNKHNHPRTLHMLHLRILESLPEKLRMND